MEKIPSLKMICDLLEEKPGAWETVKPVVKLALLVAPGTVFSSFGTAATTLAALGSGTTLADALDKVEEGLFRTKGFLWRKRPDYESPFDRPRMANALLIFAAWFDTLADEEPVLWDNLKLDEQGFDWIRQQGQEEYRKVLELVDGDGGAVLLSGGKGMLALKELYVCLKEQTQTLTQGLVKTMDLRVDWDRCPELAAVRYRRYYDVLQKYDSYHKWTGQQFHEEILGGVEEVKEGQQEILQELRKGSVSEQPGKLNLPLKSSLYEKGLFRGREAELEQIRAAFQNQKTVVLTGLGGMGKTELAARFGREWPNQDCVYLVTFRGTFRETVVLGVTEGMSELVGQKQDPDVAYALAMKRLSECTKEELMILDNVDVSQESLSSVIGELSGLPLCSIVTTRCEMAGAIEVDRLPVEELVRIFDDHKALVDMEKRLELIQTVDRHTLTVDLIARSLKGGRVKADTILKALKEQNLSEAMLPPVDADFPGAQKQEKIYGHLRTVFRVTGMSQPEKEAMRAAVLLPQSGMDAEMFQNALAVDAREAMFSLAENGWLSWQEGLVAIHPVIRLVCWEELSPTDENCGTFLISLWKGLERTRYNQTRIRQVAELCSNASDCMMDLKGQWSLQAGRLWTMLGELYKAIHYEKRMIHRMEAYYAESDPALATAYNNLGATYGKIGDQKQALKFMLKDLAICEKVLPSNHPDLATSYNNVGMTYGYLGDYDNAREYLRKAIEIREKVLSSDHPDLAISYDNMGTICGYQGNHKKALQYKQKALAIREKALLPEHPELAMSYNNVGATYEALGEHGKSLEHHLKALTIRKRVLPSDHPDLATSCNNVGTAYGNLGDHRKALEYKQKALTIREKVLHPEHPDLATAYNNVGCTYKDLGDCQKALGHLLKAQTIREKILPPEHPDLAMSYNNIGTTYGAVGDYRRSLEFLLKGQVIWEKVLPSEHPDLAICSYNIAYSLMNMGRFGEALQYIRRAVRIAERSLPMGHPHLENYRQGQRMLEELFISCEMDDDK